MALAGTPARLHWLLPDLPCRVEGPRLDLETPRGKYLLLAFCSSDAAVSLMRAGDVLLGEAPADPVRGWISPYYGEKQAALSLAIDAYDQFPLRFVTVFSPNPISCEPGSEVFLVRTAGTEIRIPKTVTEGPLVFSDGGVRPPSQSKSAPQ